jgi:predicted O-linked N-acetylglucosamine transferase (SPINDLY family)
MQNRKIKVGYFSADFHEHATAWLMADLFEQHDRERFEWHAFSFGPSLNDAMRQRLVKGFDHFHAVESLSDDEVVAMAHRLGIDVAVDLKGYTKDSRPGIFARRVAPVQVNYLGYPGSMGMPYMDYVLADRVVIPDGAFDHYSEQVVRLPQCYQPNDSKRTRPKLVLGRAAFGLPEDAFVFCSFNNNYKITPEQFALWVTILKRVPNSVLWLYVAHPDAVNNLREAARQADIAPERLLFATKVAHESHVLRYACADLFLDTFPYNAHTTASDALSMGLPLVTRQGRSFASRVAASLLHACDLPELITESPEDYVELAVQLATQPDRLKAYRQHLVTHRDSLKLFDTASLARAIERALRVMVERSRAGLAPAHFDVPADA